LANLQTVLRDAVITGDPLFTGRKSQGDGDKPPEFGVGNDTNANPP